MQPKVTSVSKSFRLKTGKHDSELDKITYWVCLYLSVPIENLFKKNRIPINVKARRYIFFIARNKGYKVGILAEYFGYEYSSIVTHASKRLYQLCRKDKEVMYELESVEKFVKSKL